MKMHMLVRQWMKRLKSHKPRAHRCFFALDPVFPGIAAIAIVLVIFLFSGWQSFERFAYTLMFRAREALPHASWDSRIAVIAIDEASLKQYGRFPWSRRYYTQLLETLQPAQPAAIGFDIIFAEATPEDQAFATAMETSGNVVLAIAADAQGNQISLVPPFAQVTRYGHVYHRPDTDGITRQSQLYLNQFPSFGLVMLQVYTDSIQNTVGSARPTSPSAIALPPPIPDLAEQPIWLNWIQPVQNVSTYSFADVIQGKVNAAEFTNRLVLVGTSATGIDPLRTPLNYNSPTAGIYKHAAVMDNLLNHRNLQPLPKPVVIVVLISLGLLTNALILKREPGGRVGVLMGLLIAWAIAAFILFYLYYQWLPIAAPLATILLTGVGMELREQREKLRLMDLFSKYVAPETAKLLWKQKDDLLEDGQLNAHEQIATVLFMDIRGFTSISEQFTPRDLLNWLNRYLEAMTDCIMDHGGVVDKYIGDAIMAVFGVPIPHTTQAEIQQDAVNAIAASLAMHHQLQILNRQLATEGKPLIQFGIGIHTGMVIAGSVGGARRMNYSVLGDVVNTAARLEALNKDVVEGNPYHLLITVETLSCLGDRYAVKPAGTIQLRGRKQPTTFFAIMGEKTKAQS
jgi:adenylate cyclase